MTKSKKQKNVICGFCKRGYSTIESAEQHVIDTHKGSRVKLYEPTKVIDLRREEDNEPSIASRMIDAQLSVAMGEYTDDDWLLDSIDY